MGVRAIRVDTPTHKHHPPTQSTTHKPTYIPLLVAVQHRAQRQMELPGVDHDGVEPLLALHHRGLHARHLRKDLLGLGLCFGCWGFVGVTSLVGIECVPNQSYIRFCCAGVTPMIGIARINPPAIPNPHTTPKYQSTHLLPVDPDRHKVRRGPAPRLLLRRLLSSFPTTPFPLAIPIPTIPGPLPRRPAATTTAAAAPTGEAVVPHRRHERQALPTTAAAVAVATVAATAVGGPGPRRGVEGKEVEGRVQLVVAGAEGGRGGDRGRARATGRG